MVIGADTLLWPPGATEQASSSLPMSPGTAPMEMPSCPTLASILSLHQQAGPKEMARRPRKTAAVVTLSRKLGSGNLGDSQFSQELQTRPSDQGVQIRFRLQPSSPGPQNHSGMSKGLAAALCCGQGQAILGPQGAGPCQIGPHPSRGTVTAAPPGGEQTPTQKKGQWPSRAELRQGGGGLSTFNKEN